jgi:hypothetical protein
MGKKGEPTQVTVCQFCSILVLGVNCYMEFLLFFFEWMLYRIRTVELLYQLVFSSCMMGYNV